MRWLVLMIQSIATENSMEDERGAFAANFRLVLLFVHGIT